MALSIDNIVKDRLASDPIRTFKFLVTFTPNGDSGSTWGNNFGKMGFVSVSGLSVSTEPIAYREGGYNTNVHQIPGQSSFTPITLSKGVMLGQNDNWLWMKRLFSVLNPTNAVGGGVGTDFRCTLDIAVLSHPNPQGYAALGNTAPATDDASQHTSMRFRVYNAWIANIGYSNLDAGQNTLMVEEMTIVHEGFDVQFASDYKNTAPSFTI